MSAIREASKSHDREIRRFSSSSEVPPPYAARLLAFSLISVRLRVLPRSPFGTSTRELIVYASLVSKSTRPIQRCG